MGVTKLRLALAALPLLAACAGGVESDPPSRDSAALSADVEAIEACGAVFTPDAELLEETTVAAARWSAATGCDVRVGDGGIRVQLVAEILDQDGHPVSSPGALRITAEGLAIEVVSDRPAPVIVHEMGHSLFPGAFAQEAYPHGHLSAPSEDAQCVNLMCSGGGAGLITAADLTYICEGFPCEAFVPEIIE